MNGRIVRGTNAAAKPVITGTIIGCLLFLGCGRSGVRERVIPVKQETAIQHVMGLLEGYANGEPMGSEIIGFPSLREAVVAEDPNVGAILARGLTELEAMMRRPGKVQGAAKKILAELPTSGPTDVPSIR